MFRPDRSRRGPDPYLGWRAGGLVLGAGTAILGMVTGSDLLIQIAIGILLAAWLSRYLVGRGEGDADVDVDADGDVDVDVDGDETSADASADPPSGELPDAPPDLEAEGSRLGE